MPKTIMSNLRHEVEVEDISPKRAKEYLDGTFERNRPIVEEVVSMYQDRIYNGDFLIATPLVFAQVGEDRLVLVDGQHRLSALSKGKKSLRFTTVTYFLGNEEDLSTLYGTLDIGRARNLNDSVRAHDLPGKMGLTQVDATRLASSLNFVYHRRPPFEIKGRLSGTFKEQIDRAKDCQHEADWFFNILKTAPMPMKTIAGRKAVVASAMITLKGYPSKAKDFWRGVLTLEGTTSVDTRFKLHMKLVDVFSRSTTSAKQFNMTSWQCGSLIACCWNAYISNRQMQIIKGLSTIVFKRCNWREDKEGRNRWNKRGGKAKEAE